MTKQIRKFSSHQTAKVFAILMAVGSLPMFLPMIVIAFISGPATDGQGNPVGFPFMIFAMFPFLYLVFGYISVRIGCWLYNTLYKYIGGIELEIVETE